MTISRLILAAGLSLLGATAVRAQTPTETETLMDEIKLDERYICAEASDDNRDIAYGNALAELTAYANEIRESNNTEALKSGSLIAIAEELHYCRGTRHTVLLYVPLEKALSITARSHAETVQQMTPQQPAAAEPTPAPVSQQPAAAAKILPDDVTRQLSGQDTWIEIKGMLTEMKQTGRITETGAVKPGDSIPDDAHAILIDGMGGIISILSPRQDGARTDSRTGRTDSESNHTECKFIVWYR